MNRTLRFITTALVFALPAALGAQDAATGVVAGRVTDASGAPLAGVHVAATRTATGAVRETTTDANGGHVITSLAPGEYRLVFEAAGFNSKTIDHVLVQVGRRLSVDAVLDVQGRAETIEVREPGVSVPTGNGLVGGVVGAGVVENLPLNGRNFLELAFLAAGQRARAQLRSDEGEHASRSPRPASSAAAATSRSTARTTTTTWWAGRCRTSRRTPCRSSRSRPTASPPSSAARRRRRSTS